MDADQEMPIFLEQRGTLPLTSDEYGQLLYDHPDESPEIVGMLDYLIDPPSRLASTNSSSDLDIPVLQHRYRAGV